jgi:membrane protein YqaA with SNARE-associated domain
MEDDTRGEIGTIIKPTPAHPVKRFLKALSRKIAITFLIGLIVLGLWIIKESLKAYGIDIDMWFQDLPVLYPLYLHMKSEISTQSFLGILYLFGVSSLFFLPIPLEVIFLGLIATSNNHFAVIAATILGMIAGQHINYAAGKALGIFLKRFKEKRKKLIDFINRCGGVAIFAIHLAPLPFQLFNFIAAITRYNYKKWSLISAISITLRIIIIYLIYARVA